MATCKCNLDAYRKGLCYEGCGQEAFSETHSSLVNKEGAGAACHGMSREFGGLPSAAGKVGRNCLIAGYLHLLVPLALDPKHIVKLKASFKHSKTENEI